MYRAYEHIGNVERYSNKTVGSRHEERISPMLHNMKTQLTGVLTYIIYSFSAFQFMKNKH